ncbi:MAG TPA: endonuclease III [bacterium]|nr:endonuclease III [bacterium]
MPRESKSQKAARARRIADGLRRLYPARCALTHDNPFQLLVATILSAQCTDERVNMVTPALFARYPDAAAFASARQGEIEKIIHPTGFFRAKAKSILGASRLIRERHGGTVPRTMAELVALPGIGRKTANVVLGTAFGMAEGVVVDTHVGRLARRMGLTAQTDPEKVERDLMDLLPQAEWIEFSHRMIWHGRRICMARKPLCSQCPIAADCRKIGV